MTATSDVDMVVWPGAPVRSELRAPSVVVPLNAGSKASVHLQAGNQQFDLPLETTDRINSPSPLWRMFRLR
jgi:hypothetical protein